MQQAVYLIVALAVAAAVLSMAAVMKAVLPAPEVPLEHAEALVFVKVKPLNGSYWLGVHAPYGDVVVRQVRVNNATYVLDTTAPVGRDVWLNASGKPITAECGDSVEVVTAKGGAARSLAFTVQCPRREWRTVEWESVLDVFAQEVGEYYMGFNETKIVAKAVGDYTFAIKNVSPEPLFITIDQFPMWLAYERPISGRHYYLLGTFDGWVYIDNSFKRVTLEDVKISVGSFTICFKAMPSTTVDSSVRCVAKVWNSGEGRWAPTLTNLARIPTYPLGQYAFCNMPFITTTLMDRPNAPGFEEPLGGCAPLNVISYDISASKGKVSYIHGAFGELAWWRPVLLSPGEEVTLKAPHMYISSEVFVISVWPAKWTVLNPDNTTTWLFYTAGLSPWRAIAAVVQREGYLEYLTPDLKVPRVALPFTGWLTLYGGLRLNVTSRPVAWLLNYDVDYDPSKFEVKVSVDQPCVNVYAKVKGNIQYYDQEKKGKWCPDGIAGYNSNWTPESATPGLYKAHVKVEEGQNCWYGDPSTPQCYTVPSIKVNFTKVGDVFGVYANGTRVGVCWGGSCPVSGQPYFVGYVSNGPLAYNYVLRDYHHTKVVRTYTDQYGKECKVYDTYYVVELYRLDRQWTSMQKVSVDSVYIGSGTYCEGPVSDQGPPPNRTWWKDVPKNCTNYKLVSYDPQTRTAKYVYICDVYREYYVNEKLINVTYIGRVAYYHTVSNIAGQLQTTDACDASKTCPALQAKATCKEKTIDPQTLKPIETTYLSCYNCPPCK